jgi:hypothetical protein
MRAIAALILFLGSTVAQAMNTWGTDFTDMWWIPTESGWGVNIIHQREILFATFFVYGADQKAHWYVASNVASTGGNTFTGELYETTGPWLGAPTFNPGAVAARTAGNVTIAFSARNRGTLTYNVDSTTVTKSIERNTFRRAELSGSYVGSAVASVTGCGSGNFTESGNLLVNLAPLPSNAITISANFESGVQCTYSGTYQQEGRLGMISGTFNCPNVSGAAGTFSASEIEAGPHSVLIKYEARYGTCVETGRMGGIR